MSSVYTRQSEPQQRILRMRELTKIVGLSRSTIYEKLNPESRYYDETFPKNRETWCCFRWMAFHFR